MSRDTPADKVNRCRWLGCSQDPVVRVPKDSPAIGEFDLPLCQKHVERATSNRWKSRRIGSDV